MDYIKRTKEAILDNVKQELQDTDTEQEIYIQDIISEEIDIFTPTYTDDCLKLLSDEKPNLEHFDKGLIDFSSLDRLFITLSYCAIEQGVYNNDFIQELQKELNNEKINKNKARDIISEIEKEQEREGFKKVTYEDNNTQIIFKEPFNISVEDFKPYVEKGFLKESQLINLSDSVKILTSNKNLNQNAIVIDEKARDFTGKKAIYTLRVYLMEKDKNLDIRNLFKLDSISEETGFNLSAGAYIEKTTEEYEQDKKLHRYDYLKHFKTKEGFIKQIVKIAQELTEISINGIKEPSNTKVVYAK